MLIVLALASELVAALYLLAMTMLVGTITFHFLVARRINLPLGPVRTAAETEISTLLLRSGLLSSVAMLVLSLPRAVGVASLLDERYALASRLSALALRTEWGIGQLAMSAATIISLVGYVAVSRDRRWGWMLPAVGLPLIAIGAGLQGHPDDAFAKLTMAPFFDGLHAVGTGAWLGAFFLLVMAGHRLPAHTASPWTDPLGALIERYFTISGALAAMVVLTGLFSGATHLTGFDDVQGTQYGRLLAGKVGIFAIMMAFNEFHRRHAERKARTSERPQLMHTLRFQAGLIGLILALTALLIDATPPGVNEVRGEVFRSAPRGAIEADDVELER